MKVTIVGGGIAGLALALSLNQRGMMSDVYEAAQEIKEVGVGITLLPHATAELAKLGVLTKLQASGITNKESLFFNRFGQLLYREERGKFAGYGTPEVGIHRGTLHRVLYEAALDRLGAEHIHTGWRCTGVRLWDTEPEVQFVGTRSRARLPPVRSDVVIACDGVNSSVRRTFYPDEKLAFGGINVWRGITVHRPVLTGRSYIRIGTIDTGKIVMYPIVDNVDGNGRQLINWATEIRRSGYERNDWNKPGDLRDFAYLYRDWTFDWLDVPQMLAAAEKVLEYPMVDRDPVTRWTFGRVTLLGDAAHPMYPRGSNGSAQALIDARVLADLLARTEGDPVSALLAYEAARLPRTSRVVQANRTVPPDSIIMKAVEVLGDRRLSDAEIRGQYGALRAVSERYKRIAGFALAGDPSGVGPC